MSRTAESTIKGFLYQFHKSINEILQLENGEVITLEGIIEDIDLEGNDGAYTAIQCKYHEAVEEFTLSLIYKPLLQMADSFCNGTHNIKSYILYVHVSDSDQKSRKISLEELNLALESTNKSLLPIIAKIKEDFDKNEFLKKVSLVFGPTLDELAEEIKGRLREIKIVNADIDNILYPNCVNYIANLSCKSDVNDRKIDRKNLEGFLSSANKTAITKWTLALKDKKQLLQEKKKQLFHHLSQNARERCFYFKSQQLEDFDAGFIIFIDNYLRKYHHKPAHIMTPIFAIECDAQELSDIQYRLYQKNIKANIGYIGTKFVLGDFYRDPICRGSRSTVSEREFSLRLISTKINGEALNTRKVNDLFIIGNDIPRGIDISDIETNILGVSKISELEFILNLRGHYE